MHVFHTYTSWVQFRQFYYGYTYVLLKRWCVKCGKTQQKTEKVKEYPKA